jgi:hypothetical protein
LSQPRDDASHDEACLPKVLNEWRDCSPFR